MVIVALTLANMRYQGFCRQAAISFGFVRVDAVPMLATITRKASPCARRPPCSTMWPARAVGLTAPAPADAKPGTV